MPRQAEVVAVPDAGPFGREQVRQVPEQPHRHVGGEPPPHLFQVHPRRQGMASVERLQGRAEPPPEAVPLVFRGIDALPFGIEGTKSAGPFQPAAGLFPLQVEELADGVDARGQARGAVEKAPDDLRRVPPVQRAQPLLRVPLPAPAPRRPGVDHLASAQGLLRGLVPHDEVVAPHDQERLRQQHLAIGRLLGLDLLRAVQEDELAHALRGPQVDAHPLVVAEALGGRGSRFQVRVEPARLQGEVFVADHVAALQGAAVLAGQVQGHALAPARCLYRLAVDLDAAHAELPAAGDCVDVVAGAHLAGQGRAGHDHPVPLEHEHPVHGQAEEAAGRGPVDAFQELEDPRPNLLQPRARDRGEADHRGAFQRGAEGQDLDLLLHVPDPRLGREIHLGDDEQGRPDAQQVYDVEVLLGLRHDAVVRGHGEQHQVDGVGPGQHVADEALVSGHVHDARLGAVRQLQVREPQVDGDAALLFLLEAVRVRSGEGLDEARLPVVDVSRGSDDVGHGVPGKARVRAEAGRGPARPGGWAPGTRGRPRS